MRADAGRPDVAARGDRGGRPFCGDHGPGKYHLSLNTSTDQYRCNLCGARGNSVTLYARLHGIGNKEAYRALAEGSKIYPMPHPPASPKTERQPLALAQRHAAYTTMLEHLVLLDQHRENLLERGLSEERIQQNQYRSMPETEQGRRVLAALPPLRRTRSFRAPRLPYPLWRVDAQRPQRFFDPGT